jgi:hypothetical protein
MKPDQKTHEWVKTRYGYAREGSSSLVTEERAPDRKIAWWYIIVTRDEDGEPSEELDITATSRKAARAHARTVLERDYVPGLKIHECILA